MALEDEPTVTESGTGQEVPMVATPLGEFELAAVLRDAYTHVLGDPPPANTLGVAWSQCAEEHARGKAIWCHNIGNITAFNWTGDYYTIHFKPGTNPNDAPSVSFRAHDDFLEGAYDYWKILSGRYAEALALFEQGLPYEAGYKLHALGYYTAPAEGYASSMRFLFEYFVTHVLTKL